MGDNLSLGRGHRTGEMTARENKECPDCGDRLFYTKNTMGQGGWYCLFCGEVKELKDDGDEEDGSE